MKYSENYHWKNIKKFQQSHDRLELFFWKTNTKLSKILNIYHKTNLSKRSWSILLYPWLYYYQSTLYDRWKIFLNEKIKIKNMSLKKKIYQLKVEMTFFSYPKIIIGIITYIQRFKNFIIKV